MIKSNIVSSGDIKKFLKELEDLADVRGKKRNEFTTSCCKTLLTTKGAMRNRAFSGTQDPITGKKWKTLSNLWQEIRRELGLNNKNILRFGFKYKKKSRKEKRTVAQRYKNVSTKGILYDSIQYKVEGGTGYIGTDIEYATRHNKGQGKTPQRRFLGVGKPDYKFFQRIIKRMLLKMEKDNKI